MTQTQQTACPKCSGTGIVERFGHVKNGVCFDCNGTGKLSATLRPAGKKADPRRAARAIGDEVLAGEQVDTDAAVEAFEFFESVHPTQWVGKDCDRRNALGRLIGRVA